MNNYLVKTYYDPGTVLHVEVIILSKIKIVSAPKSYNSVRKK